MNPSDVYETLVQRGVKFSIQGELLTFTAPKGALSAELLGLMKRYKQELLQLVRAAGNDSGHANVTFEASYGQEALWLFHQGNGQCSAYNTAATIRLLSPVDVSVLERSLVKLVHRHEALRTTFSQRQHRLIAEVHARPALDFKVIDATKLSEQQLLAQVQAEYHQPFDLASGPLFRSRLFTQTPERHVLLMTLHHIIFDASSLWLLQNELQSLYSAEVEGTAALLPAIPATYRDFAIWQRNLPETEEGQRQWEYWKEHLAGDPIPAELPWTYPRHRLGERRGATISRSIDTQLSKELRKLAKQLGTTPFATALAAFQALVYRYSGQRDFVVGTTTAGRTQPQFAQTIGYFVNVLPLRATITTAMTFAELVQQAKKHTLGALQASDFPFPLLVKRLKPVRVNNAAPLCRMMFGWQKPHAFAEVAQLLQGNEESIVWGGLRAQAYPLHQQEGQFDLTMELYDGAEALGCLLKYDRNLLSDEFASRLVDHYIHFLCGMVQNPHRRLAEYSIMSEREKQQVEDWSLTPLPAHWNSSKCDSPKAADFYRLDKLWSESVRRTPQATALVFEGRSWTYRELDTWSDQVAARLRMEGIAPEDRVVISLRRRPTVPAILLALFKCGATYVPVAPDCPLTRLGTILTESQPVLLISEGDRLENIRGFIPKATKILGHDLFEESALPCQSKAESLENSLPTLTESILAYILYTSGSSGVPKGVAVSHAAIVQHVRAMAQCYQIEAADRVLQFSDLTFDPSLEQFLTAWSVGATVVMRPETMYGGDGFWREINAKQITVANIPPSYFIECSQYIPSATSLRLLIVGGDVFPSQMLPKWRSSSVRILNAYGPTEGVITATVQEVSADRPRRMSIGRPKPGSVALILDQQLQPVPIGIPGELCLGGEMLAEGYIGDVATSKTKFLSHWFRDQPLRIYRTGDLARWNEDGEIEFLGRLDRQIKIRGYRVEPGEIEAALLTSPGVHQAFVRLCEEGQQAYLAAYVIPHAGYELTREGLLHHLKGCLPIYMLPERIGFLEAWPLNDAGKIAVDRLPILTRPAPASTHQYVPPRNALERVIARAWEEVLEVERVGVHDDFYQLGGGSLQSLRIISRLRELGVSARDEQMELTPHLLFQYVTVGELASLLCLSSVPDTIGNATPLDPTSVMSP